MVTFRRQLISINLMKIKNSKVKRQNPKLSCPGQDSTVLHFAF